jgi:hypothetical protein
MVLIVGSCVFFAVSSIPYVRGMGTSGVVLGNMCSMTVRIAYSMSFVHEFNKSPWVVCPSHTHTHTSDSDSTTTGGGAVVVSAISVSESWRGRLGAKIEMEQNKAKAKGNASELMYSLVADGAFYVVVVLVLYSSSHRYDASMVALAGDVGDVDMGVGGAVLHSLWRKHGGLIGHVGTGCVVGVAVLVHMWYRWSPLLLQAVRLTRRGEGGR